MDTQYLDAGTDLSAFVRTSRLKKGGNGRWEVHWSEPQGSNGQWRARRFSTRTTVRSDAQTILDNLRRQDRAATARAAMDHYTVDELADYYLTHHAYRKGDTAQRSFRHIQRHLGQLVPSELTPQRIAAYTRARRGERDDGLKDGTLRRELGALVACLNYAEKHDMLTKVPRIELPPQSKARVRFMTPDQAQTLWDRAMTWPGYKGSGRRIKLFVALALDTAARREAICDLTWDRVDLEARTVDYKLPDAPETNKRRIPLPMSDRLYQVLKWGAEGQSPRAHVVGVGNLRKAWDTFTREIGMPWVTPHVCRHTWATQAFARGLPLGKIAAFLGDTEGTVAGNYIHPQTDHLRDLV